MTSFEESGLAKPVLKAIAELGFETPTPIQSQAIPELLSGNRDLVALAQTGTGKTAAFGLPLANLLDFQSRKTQAVILCPTRELCMQIARDIQNYTKYMQGAHTVAIYGGASIEGQIRDVRKGPQIIVGTPGRMIDMIERGIIDLSTIEFVILDEADEMLHMGFKEDLDTILSETPEEKNTWLFSATMPNEVARIARSYMNDPFEITVGGRNTGNENIEHQYYVVHARDKYLALKRIADYNPDIFAIVFCRTKAETQEVADMLIKDGYNADALHGDLSQSQRDHVMKRYRSRALQMLVATDVAARGIDVNDVSHVINYNLPDEIESYTHRSGRTARAGKTGVSIVIINMKEVFKIRQLEKIIRQPFTKVMVPTPFEVCEKQLFHLVHQVHNVTVAEKAISSYLPKVYEELNDLSREEIIQRFISIEFNRFLDYYKSAPDLNIEERKGDSRGTQKGVVKMFVNLGQMDGLDANSLRTVLAEIANVNVQDITWVDLKNTFSLIEVRISILEQMLGSFGNAKYRGRAIRVESRGNKEAGIPRTRLRSDHSYGRGYGGPRSEQDYSQRGYDGPRRDSHSFGKKKKSSGYKKKASRY
ncbi:MAG: DEAD/DEAH box helicase [Crocinitomicaceae bacterium]|nr:DEAD/DEAH box helicase [Crocinitomicaceae bacterium]